MARSKKYARVIGSALDELMGKANTWTEKLANDAGVSPSLIRKMLGGGMCEREKIEKVAKVFGKTAEAITASDLTQESQSERFSSGIRDRMAELNVIVDKLTKEQYRVLMYLRDCHQARISGCAGSGKTMVAAEKAIRCSQSYRTTLFLCHSPLLADSVRELLRNTDVKVADFCGWVRGICNTPGIVQASPWTSYDQPSEDILAKAKDTIEKSSIKYHSIIVDEGQDFHDEWWEIVESALVDQSYSDLYIFHDDSQSIIPRKPNYPITSNTLNISGNYRNSGMVFDLLNSMSIYPGFVSPQEQLKGKGAARLFLFDRKTKDRTIADALTWLLGEGCEGRAEDAPDRIVALHGGTTPLANSPLNGTFSLGGSEWKQAVRGEFGRAIDESKTLSLPSGGRAYVNHQLDSLSDGDHPSHLDVRLVQGLAKSFRVSPETRRTITSRPGGRSELSWLDICGAMKLARPGTNTIRASEIILHFERDDWQQGLTNPRTIQISSDVGSEHHVRLYGVAEFKGLESDCILLLVEGASLSLSREIYIAFSRARHYLSILMDLPTINLLERGVSQHLKVEKLVGARQR